MIKAQHTWWADRLFSLYINPVLRSRFYRFHTLGEIPSADPKLPLLLLPNHASWWDGFFIYWLNKAVFKREGYLMMLDSELRKNRFFRYLGVYGIHPASLNVRESLNYTIGLFAKTPSPLICIFPQGKLCAWNERPIHFQKGLAWLISRISTEFQILMLGIRIEFRNEERPEVFFQFGNCCNVKPSEPYRVQHMEEEMTRILDGIENKLAADDFGQTFFQGQRSINSRAS
jgi:hypothetical protein